jgi:putative endonuclease
MGMTYLYILRSISRPQQLYVGVTADLDQRLNYHNTGRCLHTSKFRSWKIIYTEQFENEIDAFKRERQIKGWSRAKKEALIAGNLKSLKKLAKRRVY